jgi:hypothetical protein
MIGEMLSAIIARQFVRDSIYVRLSNPDERKALLAHGWEEVFEDLNGWVFRKAIVGGSEAGGPSYVN